LGTGAATALFSLVDTVVLKPLGYRQPGELVFIREVLPKMAHIYPTLPVNYQHYRFWSTQAHSLAGVAAMMGRSTTLRSGSESEAVGLAQSTASLWNVLGVEPQRGRLFTAEEESPTKDMVAVISDGLWRRRFGGSETILGQKIQIGQASCVVVGVLPASFRFPKKSDLGALTYLADRTDVFLPMRPGLEGWEGDYDYVVFGRLGRGVSLQRATAELTCSRPASPRNIG
jgi:putative ABC transport system permease protein